MTNVIPNTTPWTLLVSVFIEDEADSAPGVTEYALTGWRINEDGAHPVVSGDPDDPGELMFDGVLDGYCILALHDPATNVYREVGGGRECTITDLVGFAKARMAGARRRIKIDSEAAT